MIHSYPLRTNHWGDVSRVWDHMLLKFPVLASMLSFCSDEGEPVAVAVGG